MSTQIDNLVTSFNEVLLQTGNVFDDLCRDKSTNLVLPNQSRSSGKLNEAIRNFNRSLDDLTIQLNDVALFEMKIKQQAIEREKEQHRAVEQAVLMAQQQQENQQSQQQQQQESAQQQMNTGGDANTLDTGADILEDMNEFLSTIPDTGDMDMNGGFDDNIQQLLMENGGGDYNADAATGLNMAEFGLDAGSNDFNMQNTGMNPPGQETQNDGMEFDASIFNEIDSMLNM